MDSDALKTFVAIHRSKGFSSAAAALGRSQPAISRRIALLEQRLGVPLFERAAGGGIALSSAGRTLLPYAERVIAALGDAEHALLALRTENAGPVAFAAVGTLAGANLTPVLKRFSGEYPKVKLSIRTATSAEVSELVRRGEATIGLRYLLDRSSDIVCRHVGSETLRIACSPEHEFAGKKLKSLALLKDEQWFAFSSSYAERESFSDNVFAQFQAAGVGAIKWTPVDSQTAQKRLIEAGFGLALLPESAIAEELRAGSLATIGVRGLQLANPVYAIVRKEGYLSPAAQRLLAILGASDLAASPAPRTSTARRKRV